MISTPSCGCDGSSVVSAFDRHVSVGRDEALEIFSRGLAIEDRHRHLDLGAVRPGYGQRAPLVPMGTSLHRAPTRPPLALDGGVSDVELQPRFGGLDREIKASGRG